MAYLGESLSLHTEVETETGVSTDPADRKNGFVNPAKSDTRIRNLSVSPDPAVDDENSKYLTGDYTGDESIVGVKPATLEMGIKLAPGELNDKSITGIASAMSITIAGTATAFTPGSYEITQGIDFTTSGSGIGLVVAVTVNATSIVSIDGITEGGSGYLVSDTISVTQVNGAPLDTTPATLTIDTVETITYQHKLNYSKYPETSGLKLVQLYDDSVPIDDYKFPVKHLFFPTIQKYEDTLSAAVVEKDPKPGKDGIIADMFGAIGNMTLTADNTGEPFMMNFAYSTGLGEDDVYELPSDKVPNFDFDDTNVMRTTADNFLAATIRIKDIELDTYLGEICTRSITLEQGNQITMRPCSSNSSGIKSHAITAMQPRFTVNPELQSLSDFDYWNALVKERFYQIEVESRYSSPEGEIVLQQFIPRAQLLGSSITSDEGFRRNELTWKPIRNIDKTFPVVTYQDNSTGDAIVWDGSDLTESEKAQAMYYIVISEIPVGYVPTP